MTERFSESNYQRPKQHSKSANNWWERSPNYNNTNNFCNVNNTGNANNNNANNTNGFAPFGTSGHRFDKPGYKLARVKSILDSDREC